MATDLWEHRPPGEQSSQSTDLWEHWPLGARLQQTCPCKQSSPEHIQGEAGGRRRRAGWAGGDRVPGIWGPAREA